MDSVRHDESQWPIVTATMPSHPIASDEFERHLSRVSSYYERGEPFGLIIDVRHSPSIPADQRRLTAERMDQDRKRFGYACPCAILVTSPMQSAVMQVLMWLTTNPGPLSAFSTPSQATQWLRSCLAGIPVGKTGTGRGL